MSVWCEEAVLGPTASPNLAEKSPAQRGGKVAGVTMLGGVVTVVSYGLRILNATSNIVRLRSHIVPRGAGLHIVR